MVTRPIPPFGKYGAIKIYYTILHHTIPYYILYALID